MSVKCLCTLAGTRPPDGFLNSLPQHFIQTELQKFKARWFGTLQRNPQASGIDQLGSYYSTVEYCVTAVSRNNQIKLKFNC